MQYLQRYCIHSNKNVWKNLSSGQMENVIGFHENLQLRYHQKQ